jgi:hypothetical protein
MTVVDRLSLNAVCEAVDGVACAAGVCIRLLQRPDNSER